ncbi:UNVERIFIED_CONTAM: hypothetical protein HDU68_002536 [Siphonaria sp. JEL0065]|nr:hypothetical protein HDU68_002536 [Siphonaria sp. JEL0065]
MHFTLLLVCSLLSSFLFCSDIFLSLFQDEYHRDLCLLVQNRVQEIPEEFRNENHAIAPISSSTTNGVPGAPNSSAAIREFILAEETLSLYLTTLRLYQFGLESARALWSREQTRLARVGSTSSSGTPRVGSPHSIETGGGGGSEVAVDLQSLNASVQWMKDKFDDCLERAQEVKGVLGEGPPPSAGNAGVGEDDGGGSIGGGMSGVRAVDRMVYERSLEVCRAAAQAESTGLYQSAEIGYTHAVHLLEAILYAPPPSIVFQGSLASSLMDSSLDAGNEIQMSDADRIVVERFLLSIGKRMSRLRELL